MYVEAGQSVAPLRKRSRNLLTLFSSSFAALYITIYLSCIE